MEKRILIVEKELEPDIMIIIESILPGVKTYHFSLGNSLSNLPERLDVALFDPYGIPNPKDLIKEIKDKYPEMPVIGFTTESKETFHELGLKTDGVIYKPFSKEEFKEKMKKYI